MFVTLQKQTKALGKAKSKINKNKPIFGSSIFFQQKAKFKQFYLISFINSFINFINIY